MDTQPAPETNPAALPAVPPAPAAPGHPRLKIFGVGTTGLAVLDRLIGAGMLPQELIAIGSNPERLERSAAATKIHLEKQLLRGLGSGGDPERMQTAAEQSSARLKGACEGADFIFIVAGLGGGTGSGITPVLAQCAKDSGACVLGFTALPFDCEGSRRQTTARAGLERISEHADAVICLPNQNIFKLINENTGILEAFDASNSLLAEGLQGVWRLLTAKGLIEIEQHEFCELLRARHTENTFATAEAAGPKRCDEILEKLTGHPLLDGGAALQAADAIVVSVTGGPELSMSDVNRIMQHIQSFTAGSQVTMGAAIDQAFRERLAVTIVLIRKLHEFEPRDRSTRTEELDTQLLTQTEPPRPGSRLLPPPPELPPDKMQQMLKRHRGSAAGARKAQVKLRQTQLPLEIVSKGRFDKSEPTIHKGEDLDVPTYIRRGVALN